MLAGWISVAVMPVVTGLIGPLNAQQIQAESVDMCNSALGVCMGRSTAPLRGRNQVVTSNITKSSMENSCTSKRSADTLCSLLLKLIEARGYVVGANLHNARAQNAYFVVHN